MADEEKKADDKKPDKKPVSLLTKIVASVGTVLVTVFTVIVAPTIVGIVKAWVSAPAHAPPPATNPVHRDGGLITSRLSENFYSFGWSPQQKREVRNDNVDPALFTYDTATQTLQAPGKLVGVLVTKKDYENYVLTVEYKWGEHTYAGREGKARWGGVEVHGTGPDGQVAHVWMQGYEVLLHEGQAGSVDLRGPENAVKAMATMKERPEGTGLRRDFAPPPQGVSIPLMSGIKGIPSLLHALGTPDKIDNVPASHPPDDWNTVKITCDGPTLRVEVNGKEVNHLTGLNHTKGKILIAPQHAEIAFRRIAVEPIKK